MGGIGVNRTGVHAQGVDGWDVDLPTFLEANIITTTLAKLLWVFVYIAVYGLRPIIIRPKPIGAARSAFFAVSDPAVCFGSMLPGRTSAPVGACRGSWQTHHLLRLDVLSGTCKGKVHACMHSRPSATVFGLLSGSPNQAGAWLPRYHS